MIEHDPFREAKLPKWAQDILSSLRQTVAQQETELAAIRESHAVLSNKGWFTVKGFSPDAKFHPAVTLYYFTNNSANALCTIGPDDVLLVGRERQTWNEAETKRRYELALAERTKAV
jgi:hypothetical protein